MSTSRIGQYVQLGILFQYIKKFRLKVDAISLLRGKRKKRSDRDVHTGADATRPPVSAGGAAFASYKL